MNEENDGNGMSREEHMKKKKRRIDHNKFAILFMVINTLFLLYVIGYTHISWDMLASKMFNVSLYTVILFLMMRFFKSKYASTTNKLWANPIAVGVFFMGYAIGLGLILAGGSSV